MRKIGLIPIFSKTETREGLEPHEQVERAGRVLWILLKSWRAPKNPSIISVLLTI